MARLSRADPARAREQGEPEEAAPATGAAIPTETVALAALRAHPRNYVEHPDDELEHLRDSIKAHGIYRNVVVARDDTILAGHGVVAAAKSLGFAAIPVVRLPYDRDDPRALKVLTGDNEIAHLREIDDRALSELLREIERADPDGLAGTGYDEEMLANLVYVTRPREEIADIDEAAHWVGLPEYDEGDGEIRLIVHFASEADRDQFVLKSGLTPTKADAVTPKAWWPPKPLKGRARARFEAAGGENASGEEETS